MKLFHVVYLALVLPFLANAKVKLKDFEYQPGKDYGTVKIRYKGNLITEPVYSIKKNMLQVHCLLVSTNNI